MSDKRERHEVGAHKGIKYRLIFAQNYKMGGFEPELAYSWFLMEPCEDGGDLIGMFGTKREALECLDNIAHDKVLIDWFKEKGYNISVLGVDQ